MISILPVLKESMHTISSALLAPTIAILLFFIVFIVFELGSLLVEAIFERRNNKKYLPELLDVLPKVKKTEIVGVIENSRIGKRHQSILIKLTNESDLPAATLETLARNLLANEEEYYYKITNKTDIVARLGPMLGLMATLIPLGPGLIALGNGNTKLLADSLLTAFDATVTGLAAAGVAFAISQIRKRWYEGYLNTLEALLETLLEVLANERGAKE